MGPVERPAVTLSRGLTGKPSFFHLRSRPRMRLRLPMLTDRGAAVVLLMTALGLFSIGWAQREDLVLPPACAESAPTPAMERTCLDLEYSHRTRERHRGKLMAAAVGMGIGGILWLLNASPPGKRQIGRASCRERA